MTSLEKTLTEFRDANSLKSKGQLAVMLHITRLAAENGLPLELESLLTVDILPRLKSGDSYR